MRLKLAQYTMREGQIVSADASGMRQRWMWGLRLQHDPQAFGNGSSQLRPGVREALVSAAAKRGLKLSEREIGYRLQCARAYKTEAEFGTAVLNFPDWTSLRDAGFPPFPVISAEGPADWRTDAEKNHDRARAWLDVSSGMDAMFPLRDFEPVETTLADLELFMKQQMQITQNFIATQERRRSYLDRLKEAAGYDLTMTWQEAHDRLSP